MEDIKKYIKEIKSKIEEDGEGAVAAEPSAPGNVTANVTGYNIPGAFARSEKEHRKRIKKSATSYGYKLVKKKKPKYFIPIHKKSLYKEFANAIHMNEARYIDFKKDETHTPKHKINLGIKKINRALYELESIVAHNHRLKNEMAITQDAYWKSSKTKLHKIAERLIKISKKIVELSA
jgi:hypothetical protein